MKAMVFAAGIGSRLQPFTNTLPKALVEVDGKPMISWILERLHLYGCELVVVNVFHHAGMLIHFLDCQNYSGMKIVISDERPELLDTGGGLERAQQWLGGNDPVLLCNVDVISDLDLHNLIQTHKKSGALATLAVQDRLSSRKLIFDEKDNLVGWCDHQKSLKKWVKNETVNGKELSFSGIHVVSPTVFELMPQPGPSSIIDLYLKLAGHYPVVAYRHDEGFWTDLGKPADLEHLNAYLRTPQGIQWKKTYLKPS